jgi:hypothetical protein
MHTAAATWTSPTGDGGDGVIDDDEEEDDDDEDGDEDRPLASSATSDTAVLF